jgi:HlyD family secretion protein
VNRTAAALLCALALGACKSKAKDPAASIQTAAVTRQDIVVDVEATGVVTPINPVQVKSKASGTVLKIFVELGSQVQPGALLVKIDPRIPQNSYDQAAAALKAAQANVAVTRTQYARDSLLFSNGVLTSVEMEAAQLAYANATSQLVGARTGLDNASISLEDVTIRAVSSGTVIERDVSVGQVIASATGNVSGGTQLMVMANLAQIMDSTLVAESDIGSVKPGQTATVKVDAYPNRSFHGTVEKISPQATVQQSVTMFPVFIRIDNQDGALMPGMNSDVSILVEQRDNALAVPNDAVRSPRDARAAATALGLDPTQVMSQLTGARKGGSDSASGTTAAPSVSQPQCDSVQKLIAAHPAIQKQLADLRQQMQAGGDRTALGAKMRAAYDSLHVDAGVARACAQLRRTSAGGTALAMGSTEENPGAGNTKPRPGLVFLAQNGTFVPKILTLGVGNYDVTQVIAGLAEGDKVALINAAMLQQARQQTQARIQSRMGLPGVQQQPAAGANRQGGAAAGGATKSAAAGGATKSAAPAAPPAPATTTAPAAATKSPPGAP